MKRDCVKINWLMQSSPRRPLRKSDNDIKIDVHSSFLRLTQSRFVIDARKKKVSIVNI